MNLGKAGKRSRFQLVKQAALEKLEGPHLRQPLFLARQFGIAAYAQLVTKNHMFSLSHRSRGCRSNQAAATTRHALDSLPFDPALRKTSIPISGLPSCAVGPSAARLHFRQRERWRILSRVGVESWLDDPGTNRPRGTVVPPTSMKGVLPWTTSLCAMRANSLT